MATGIYKNPEKRKTYLKTYYEAHREEIRARHRDYYQNNKERLKKAANDYYEKRQVKH